MYKYVSDQELSQQEMMAGKIINLGCMNGWLITPPVVNVCREAKHELVVTSLGRCYNEYYCPICGYRYQIDSSD